MTVALSPAPSFSMPAPVNVYAPAASIETVIAPIPTVLVSVTVVATLVNATKVTMSVVSRSDIFTLANDIEPPRLSSATVTA